MWIDGAVRSSEANVDSECRQLPAKKRQLVCHTVRLLQGTFKYRVVLATTKPENYPQLCKEQSFSRSRKK
jgi:hypothetical protein